jgi:hypothetical protein
MEPEEGPLTPAKGVELGVENGPTSDREQNYFVRKLDDVRAQMGKRTGPNIIWLREREDDTRLRLPDRDFSDGIPTTSAAMCDAECGLVLIGGLPNAGKSTYIVNQMMQSLQLNDNYMCMDFSLDDDLKKRYQQYVACLTGLSYQEISTNVQLTAEQRQKKIDMDALIDKFYMEDRLRTYEAIETVTDEDGATQERSLLRPTNILHVLKRARRQYPERKIVAFVDAFHDLEMRGDRGSTDFGATETWIKELKTRTKEYNTLMVFSAHLNKIEGKQSTMDSFKGTGYLAYSSIYAAIARNEYRENPYAQPLVYEHPDGRILPMLAIDNVKNKVSAWTDPLFYGLDSLRCQLIPLSRAMYESTLVEYRGKRAQAGRGGRGRD